MAIYIECFSQGIKMMDSDECLTLIGAFVAIGIALVCVSYGMGKSVIRKEAVENNAAYYEVDKKTGDTAFIWNGRPQ